MLKSTCLVSRVSSVQTYVCFIPLCDDASPRERCHRAGPALLSIPGFLFISAPLTPAAPHQRSRNRNQKEDSTLQSRRWPSGQRPQLCFSLPLPPQTKGHSTEL